MGRIGKSFTGGMGHKTERGVWVCVRDWNAIEQARCGAAPGRYACFAFNELHQHFDFLGLNEKTQLVRAASSFFFFFIIIKPRALHPPS